MINKFYKIGEVSKMLDLPASTLRYWEKQFKQLKPVKSTGGQRFYTSEHIDLLEQLKDMLHSERYTIEGTKQRLKEIIAAGKNAENQADNSIGINAKLSQSYNNEDIKKDLNEILKILQQ